MIQNLQNWLELGFKLKATNKTQRYCVSRLDDVSYGSVIKTFCAICLKLQAKETKLEVKGATYDVREYSFPVSLNELLSLSRVFVSPNDFYDEPWFRLDVKLSKDSKGEILTPYEVEKLFYDYNYNQEPENSVAMKKVEVPYITVCDLGALCSKDGFVELNPAGKISKEACFMSGIANPFKAGKTMPKFSDQELALWLMERKDA